LLEQRPGTIAIQWILYSPNMDMQFGRKKTSQDSNPHSLEWKDIPRSTFHLQNRWRQQVRSKIRQSGYHTTEGRKACFCRLIVLRTGEDQDREPIVRVVENFEMRKPMVRPIENMNRGNISYLNLTSICNCVDKSNYGDFTMVKQCAQKYMY
jgi:hypothetical protein